MPARTSGLRWSLMIFLIAPITFAMSLDRTAIAVAAPTIQHEYGFTLFEMSVILTSFSWTYALDLLRKSAPGTGIRRVIAGGVSLASSEWSESIFQVHQSGDDRDFGVMCTERISKPLSGNPEPFGSSDPMLNPDAESTQATIILHLIIGEFPVLWLLVWKLQVRMLLVVALVGTVRVEPRLLR